MKIKGIRAAIAGIAAFVTIAAPDLAAAQSGGFDRVINAPAAIAELRARQAELFEQLIAKPDDLDLMFEYAVISIRLEDYEAAISTLERMLIYRQDLPRVRLELAVAYFNLGSYEVSELYFDQVLAEPSTPDTVRARIDRYKEAITFRTRKTALSGIVNAGITYASNATLGPDGDQVQVAIGGVPTVLNVVNGREEGDFGSRVIVSLSHAYDLQQEDLDTWQTDFTAFSVRYFGSSAGDVEFLRLRTGPRLSLDNQQFGPKIRPYIEGQYLVSDNRGLFGGYGLGAEVTDTISPIMSVYGDVGMRYRNYFRQEFEDEDAYNFFGSVGLAYIPMRDLVLRGTLLTEVDAANAEFNSNYEVGLRVSGEYQYDSGLSWVDRKWSASAFGEFRFRQFDEPDPAIDPDNRRRDLDFRAGLSHVFTLQQGFGIQFDVDALLRDSNIINFDLSNVSATVSAQYRF